MIKVMILALILAIGVNGVAIAFGNIDQQQHCVDALEVESYDATADVAHNQEMDGSSHTVLGHDHDTCISHASSALFPNLGSPQDLAGSLLATLTMQEHALHAIARSENLYRPPNT